MVSAQCRSLGDGRLHFQHGPMDIVIGAEGEPRAVQAAHARAWARFQGLLQELVAELPQLRAAVDGVCRLRGPVARRMWAAAAAHRPAYVTPMVAVAGAVAQELVQAYTAAGVSRAWVNNGGDIALHLTPGTSWRIGLCADPESLRWLGARDGLQVDGQFDVAHASGVRGVATSGWKGRSFSLGIADSVTVLAATAAEADAAASLIANAVNVQAPGIVRAPANTLKDDSDLGTIPVTVSVPTLAPSRVQQALQAGLDHALALQRAGRITACVLTCQGQAVSTPASPAPKPATPSVRAHPQVCALETLDD
ncbi:MAG: hypothetical protein RL559_1274 [Pseudomonadota bacterium]